MKKMKKSMISDFIIGIILTLLVLFVFLLSFRPLETLEYGVYDLNVRMRIKPAAAPVVVVAIDEQSITNLGRWPWPRANIAAMVDHLLAANAKVVGLDIIYSEKDVNQGLIEVRNILQATEAGSLAVTEGTVAALRDAEKRLDNDAILAASILNSRNVILPLFFVMGKSTGRTAGDLPPYLESQSIRSASFDHVLTAREIVPPIAEFASGAAALGHINIVADPDGVVRSEPLFIHFTENLFPSFALQLTLKYLNIDLRDVRIGKDIQFGRKTIPLLDNNRMLISFVRDIPSYSFFDVIHKKIPPEAFQGKIVIVAQSAAGLGTMQVTPASVSVPPGTIIANVIDNILNSDHIIRPEWAFTLELIMIIIFGFYITLVIPRLKAGISAVVSLALLLAWIITTVYLFAAYGYWVKPVYASILLIVGYMVIVSKRYLLTEKTNALISADSVETNKMLGLSFQGQGLLDMAFEKFRKCPVEDESVRELLYNLGLDFERKRMFNKAVAVYQHIAQTGKFKDINERIKRVTAAGETMLFGSTGTRKDSTVIMENADIKPTLGRYEITRELGHGAMGTVFLGRDPRINRDVAIKTLRYEDIDPEDIDEVKKRFFREAEAAGKLSHPNIVTIYDVGEDHDIAYLAMELLDGNDLVRYCRKGQLLPLSEVIRVVASVAAALDYAHAHGIVHRDIKPANIMVINNSEIKVADFGIARVMAASKTQTGIILGTPSYMSPEQIAGKRVEGPSDLFSLGVVMYELLTGEKPFTGEELTTLMYNITSVAPRSIKELSPDVPDKVMRIVGKLLAKEVEPRYKTGKDLMNDLGFCLE